MDHGLKRNKPPRSSYLLALVDILYTISAFNTIDYFTYGTGEALVCKNDGK